MNEYKSIKSTSSEKTEEAGEDFSKILTDGSVVALSGDLGSGKTCFVRGICKGLGIENVVRSPTYTLLNIYDGALKVFHLDIYRLKNREELYQIGYDELLSDKKGICIIEWAERIDDIIPKNSYWINMDYVSDNERNISICTK